MKHKSVKHVVHPIKPTRNINHSKFKIWDYIMKQSPEHETYPCPSHFET